MSSTSSTLARRRTPPPSELESLPHVAVLRVLLAATTSQMVRGSVDRAPFIDGGWIYPYIECFLMTLGLGPGNDGLQPARHFYRKVPKTGGLLSSYDSEYAVYALPDKPTLKVCLMSDWATGSPAAMHVLGEMQKLGCDTVPPCGLNDCVALAAYLPHRLTRRLHGCTAIAVYLTRPLHAWRQIVHLGDTYYSGTPQEQREYLMEPLLAAFGEDTCAIANRPGDRTIACILSLQHAVACPLMVSGSLRGGAGPCTLCLATTTTTPTATGSSRSSTRSVFGSPTRVPRSPCYPGARARVRILLSQMGHQEATYFCIRSPTFQMIGLDTGLLNSNQLGSTLLPFLSDDQLAWAKAQIAYGKEHNLKTIVTSHHQFFSRTEGLGVANSGMSEKLTIADRLVYGTYSTWMFSKKADELPGGLSNEQKPAANTRLLEQFTADERAYVSAFYCTAATIPPRLNPWACARELKDRHSRLSCGRGPRARDCHLRRVCRHQARPPYWPRCHRQRSRLRPVYQVARR